LDSASPSVVVVVKKFMMDFGFALLTRASFIIPVTVRRVVERAKYIFIYYAFASDGIAK